MDNNNEFGFENKNVHTGIAFVVYVSRSIPSQLE